MTVAVHSDRDHYENTFDWWDRALVFEVVASDAMRFQGSALLPIAARFERRGARKPLT